MRVEIKLPKWKEDKKVTIENLDKIVKRIRALHVAWNCILMMKKKNCGL
jgi:hypothetical protein